jgi:hypothetical protein
MFPAGKYVSVSFDPVAKKAGTRNNTGRIITENLEEMFHKRRSTLLVIPAISRQVLLMAQHLDGCCIAGGAALAVYTGDVGKIKDWDLFFTDPSSLRAARDAIKGLDFTEYKESTDWSDTFEKSGVIVQLITHKFYNSVKNIFSNFDFSVCCFAIDGPNIKYTEQAAEDVANGQMNLIHTDNLVACVKRIARYGQKGFKPTTEFVKNLVRMAYDTDLDNLEESNGCS